MFSMTRYCLDVPLHILYSLERRLGMQLPRSSKHKRSSVKLIIYDSWTI